MLVWVRSVPEHDGARCRRAGADDPGAPPRVERIQRRVVAARRTSMNHTDETETPTIPGGRSAGLVSLAHVCSRPGNDLIRCTDRWPRLCPALWNGGASVAGNPSVSDPATVRELVPHVVLGAVPLGVCRSVAPTVDAERRSVAVAPGDCIAAARTAPLLEARAGVFHVAGGVGRCGVHGGCEASDQREERGGAVTQPAKLRWFHWCLSADWGFLAARAPRPRTWVASCRPCIEPPTPAQRPIQSTASAAETPAGSLILLVGCEHAAL
jgi:hypothetical protein